MGGSALGGAGLGAIAGGVNSNPGPQYIPSAPSGGGKGGMNINRPKQPTAQAPTQGQYAPMAPTSGFNVNQAAAGGLQQAMQGTQAAMVYQPQQVRPTDYTAAQAGSQGYGASTIAGARDITAQNVVGQGYDAERAAKQSALTADQVQAGQIASTDLGAYTNPYETQVVQQSLDDLERSRLMQQNQLGAQANAAGAFGGSRQGIAEAETNRAFADQAARTASGLRQTGFQNAQQLAGQDIGYNMQAGLANQGANLQAGTTNAQLGQQINLANQAAGNQASQFGAAATNQANLANQSANLQAQQATASNMLTAQQANQAALNQASQFGAGAANTASLQNQAALNAQRNFGATQGMTAQQLNQGAGLQGAQMRMNAANQMGGLGQQAFQTGRTISQDQMQQGLMQQGLQQALIDAARGQYAGFTGAPERSLGLPLAALGAQPNQSTTTQSKNPGLFDYLSLGATAAGSSDARLKTDIKPIGSHKGVKLYTWNWNDEGKRIADPAQPTIGVIAQELRETHPHLVEAGDDGYLRVNYAGLNSELEAA